jgi:hypothetical protein
LTSEELWQDVRIGSVGALLDKAPTGIHAANSAHNEVLQQSEVPGHHLALFIAGLSLWMIRNEEHHGKDKTRKSLYMSQVE